MVYGQSEHGVKTVPLVQHPPLVNTLLSPEHLGDSVSSNTAIGGQCFQYVRL